MKVQLREDREDGMTGACGLDRLLIRGVERRSRQVTTAASCPSTAGVAGARHPAAASITGHAALQQISRCRALSLPRDGHCREASSRCSSFPTHLGVSRLSIQSAGAVGAPAHEQRSQQVSMKPMLGPRGGSLPACTEKTAEEAAAAHAQQQRGRKVHAAKRKKQTHPPCRPLSS
jgi:hypothetical protein